MSVSIKAPGAMKADASPRQITASEFQHALDWELRINTLLGERELLREAIKRGAELLDQAQKELAQNRLQLEEWLTYEQRCGANCLPELTERVSGSRRIERFLTGWLKRQQRQLDAVEQTLRLVSQECGAEPQQPKVAVPGAARHEAGSQMAQAA
jgi:hypothetical protein